MAESANKIKTPTAGRPQTSEKITITDFRIKRANPTPQTCEEVDILLEEYLSPRKLKALTGMDDLTKVKCLQLKVDTTETSLGNFGTFLPNLQELKIKDGIVPSIRDLGSSLSNVQILWMPRCSLQELDGITTLENLAELFIAYNDVAELSPLSMLEQLRLLDIEGNHVDDLKQVEYLAFCPKLTTLTLDGNPIAINEKRVNGQQKYRRSIKKIIPQLCYLDDVQLDDEKEECQTKAANAFEDDWNYINTFILHDSTSMDSSSALASSKFTPTTDSPSTASSCSGIHTPLPRPTTGYRPGSALKPSTAEKHQRLATARHSNQSYPQTARPPSTAGRRLYSEDINMLKDAASELTMGEVVCGNPAKSLRNRTRTARGSANTGSLTARTELGSSTARAQNAALTDADLDDRTRQLFEEAMDFRKQHEPTRRMIEQDRVPQVLKIDFNEEDSLAEKINSKDSALSCDESGEEDEQTYDPPTAVELRDLKRQPVSVSSVGTARDLPPPPSPVGSLNPLKVPAPPSGNAPTGRNRPYIPNGKSKQSLTESIPPPDRAARSASQKSVLLPSKLSSTKINIDK